MVMRFSWITKVAAAICMVLLAPIAAHAEDKVLHVVGDENYPPYLFINGEGQADGYLVDLWKLWEGKTGVKVELKPTEWEEAQRVLLRGDADVIENIFRTPGREPMYDFSAPYAELPVNIYRHTSISGINSLAQLQGFQVGAMAGDACVEKLNAAGISTLVKYSNYSELIRAAKVQEIKVFCLDQYPANFYLYQQGAHKQFVPAFLLYQGQFHRAVRKGNLATLQLVERGMAAISKEEKETLRKKWLSEPVDYTSYVKYAGIGAAIALLVLGLLTSWIYFLRRAVATRTRALVDNTRELEQARDELASTIQAIPDLLFELDEAGRYLQILASRDSLLAETKEALLGKTVNDVLPAEAAETVLLAIAAAIKAGSDYGRVIQLPLDDGEHWFELSVSRKGTGDLEKSTCLVLSRDITARKNAEDRIQELAFSDPLTSLPNRRLLMDRLDQALTSAHRHNRQAALLFIDLDDFKTINDTLGHQIGDALLIQVAQRLTSCVRESDTVARLGGDEFIVMLEDLSNNVQEAATQAQVVSEKIHTELSRSYAIEGHEHHSTASIGVTLFGGSEREKLEEPLQRAELAMYQAKAAGRNTLRLFEPQMRTAVTTRATLEAELREAVTSGQFVLYYQPQGGTEVRISGVEALVRWQHPQRGLVPPAEFISIAESSGLILPLGRRVLETACKQLAAWEAQPELSSLKIAVNVSARQFRQDEFVQEVLGILNASGAKPERLNIELTESVLVDNVEDVIVKMNALKAKGVGFSIDDFGTGYSSLAYLKRLPLDQLKIDKSFIRDILTDPDDAAIARMVVALADSLGLSVIAEGVETEAQKNFLETLGCKNYQGYLFSRPLPLMEFEAFAAETSQTLSS